MTNDGGNDNNKNGGRLENGLSNGNYVDREESKVDSILNGKVKTSSSGGAFDINKLQKLRTKGGKKTDTAVNKGSKAKPKKNRVWDGSPPETKLDFADPVCENGDNNVEVVAADQGESMIDKEDNFDSESDSEDEEEVGKDGEADAKKNDWFSSMFQR